MAGARAHNRWLAELCPDSPERRAGVAIVPIYDPDAAVAEITPGPRVRACAAASSSRRCGAPRRRTTTPATTRCGRRARTCRCRCTCTRGSADKAAYGAARRHLHHRGALVVGPAAVVPAVVGRVRAHPGPALRRHRVRRLLGRRPAVDDGHRLRPRARRPEARRAADRRPVDAPERVLRPQLRHRRVEHPPPRAGPPLRDRRRQHHVGQRLPPPRGHVAAHPRVAARRLLRHPRRRDRARCSGCNAAEMYGFDVDALRPLADKVGPDAGRARPGRRRPRQVGRARGPPAGPGSPASRRSRPASVRDAAGRRSTRSSRASTPGPTTSTGGCARPSRSTGASCCRAGCSPASTTCRPCCGTTRSAATSTGRKPSPVVDLLRARSGRNAAQRDGMTARAAGRPRARPHPQAHAARRSRPARSSELRGLGRRSGSTRHLDRLGAVGRGRAHRRLRLPAAGRGVLRHARHRRPRRARASGRGPRRSPAASTSSSARRTTTPAWSCSRRCRSTCPTRPTRSGPRPPTTCCPQLVDRRGGRRAAHATTSSSPSSSRSTWPATSRRPR